MLIPKFKGDKIKEQIKALGNYFNIQFPEIYHRFF